MHLLVLSAFRRWRGILLLSVSWCLNAPSGAQCFPTASWSPTTSERYGLNAPSGAQCFPTVILALAIMRLKVSMHLLVLSAFRHSTSTLPSSRSSGLNAPSGAQCFPAQLKSHYKDDWETSLNAPSGAQCFPTIRAGMGSPSFPVSQCTFWCSVLSDTTIIKASMVLLSCLNAPSGAQCFPTIYPALPDRTLSPSLNAPSGAQCFPTPNQK